MSGVYHSGRDGKQGGRMLEQARGMRRAAEDRHRSGRGIGRERERSRWESEGDAGFFNDDGMVVSQRGQIDMSQVQK